MTGRRRRSELTVPGAARSPLVPVPPWLPQAPELPAPRMASVRVRPPPAVRADPMAAGPGGGTPGPGARPIARTAPGTGSSVPRQDGERCSRAPGARTPDFPAAFRATPASESSGRFKGRGNLRRAPAARPPEPGRVPRLHAPEPGLGAPPAGGTGSSRACHPRRGCLRFPRCPPMRRGSLQPRGTGNAGL